MKAKYLIFIFILLLILSGCADHIQLSAASNALQVGFWYGLWHGLIMPLAWFISLFSDDVAIYAIYNNGGWYDFGFLLGVSSAFGSSCAASKK